jgi:hypothetical protein
MHSNATKNARQPINARNLTMQSGKSLIIGASLGALINIGTVGAAEAPQSSDSNSATKPSHKANASAKSLANSSKEMTAQLQALCDQVDALQRRLDAQNAAEQQTKATADQAAAQAASANAEAATATAAAQAIPTEVKTAIDAATPRTDKIYYKGVTLTLGGFGALESVFRTKNETADLASTARLSLPMSPSTQPATSNPSAKSKPWPA